MCAYFETKSSKNIQLYTETLLDIIFKIMRNQSYSGYSGKQSSGAVFK